MAHSGGGVGPALVVKTTRIFNCTYPLLVQVKKRGKSAVYSEKEVNWQ